MFADAYYVLNCYFSFFFKKKDASDRHAFFFQAEDGIRDGHVTGVQTCALPISHRRGQGRSPELVSVAQVEGLSKRYGSVQALDRVDVVVEPGCTGLVGSNGAGKSTLIKLLLGLLAPDQGRASVLGHDVAADPLGVRSQVGYLPEGACLPG